MWIRSLDGNHLIDISRKKLSCIYSKNNNVYCVSIKPIKYAENRLFIGSYEECMQLMDYIEELLLEGCPTMSLKNWREKREIREKTIRIREQILASQCAQDLNINPEFERLPKDVQSSLLTTELQQ